MSRRLACPIQEDVMTCGERRCGCGWPDSCCRAMYPGEWAVAMLARDRLWHDFINFPATTTDNAGALP